MTTKYRLSFLRGVRFQTWSEVVAQFGLLTVIGIMLGFFATEVTAQGTCSGPGGGSGVSAYVEYKTAYADCAKLGFSAFTNTDLPRINIYHDQVSTFNYASTVVNTNDPNAGGDCIVTPPGGYTDTTTWNQTATLSEYITGCGGTYSNSCTGNWLETDITDITSVTTCTGSCWTEYGPSTDNDIFSGPVVAVAVDESSPLGWSWAVSETNTEISQWMENSCPGDNFTNGLTTNVTYSSVYEPVWFPSSWIIVSATSETNATIADSGFDIWTRTLGGLYSDPELSNNIMENMPPYPSNWYIPNGDATLDNSTAYSMIDGTHCCSGAPWPTQNGQSLPEMQQMEYRICIPDSQSQNTYLVTWQVVTVDFTTGSINAQSMSISLMGTGDTNNPLCSGIYQVFPPYWDPSMTVEGGMVVTWVDNVSVSVQNSSALIGSGPGAIVSGGTSGACATCAANSQANYVPLGGMSATFSMGQTISNFPAGFLKITSCAPTTNLATPAGLSFSANVANVTVIQTTNGIRQVNAPQGLANVTTNSPFSYAIGYYLPSQVGGMSGGVYTLSGSPFLTWTVANPNASTNSINTLEVTQTQGGVNQAYTYLFNTNTGSWTFDYPGNLREEQITPTANVSTNGNSTLTLLKEIRVPGQADDYTATEIYQTSAPKGNGSGFVLTQRTVGPSSNPQVTTYSYTSAAQISGQVTPSLSMIVRPNGSWASYQYGSGQLSEEWRPLGDTAAPSPGSGVGSGAYQYQYAYNTPSGNPVTNFVNVPRSITEQPNGNSYLNITPGATYYTNAPSASPPYSTLSLITITNYFTSGVNSNLVSSIQYPNGTMAIFAYATSTGGYQTNTVWTGAPNSGKTSIVNGTETITVLGPVGQMVSYQQIDIASSITLANDVYGNYDSYSRPQLVTHLDGTTEQTYYGCCGMDETVDRDGVATYYYYDAANRQNATMRNGITITNILDSAGRTLETIRIGTNGNQIIMGQWQYDSAGRLIAQTNALGGVTTYVESYDPTTGGLIRTTTNPDGSTIIDKYFLDGTLKMHTGTAVHGVRYTNYFISSGFLPVGSAEIKLNANGTDSSEGVTNYDDVFGRVFETQYNDGSFCTNWYNTLGQLTVQEDPDGVMTLFQYDAKGEQTYTILDMEQDWMADWTGTNQITMVTNDVTTDHGTNVLRTRTYAWTANGANTSNLVSMSETSTTGLLSWQTQYSASGVGVTNETQTVYGANRVVTATAPDGSYTISTYTSGILVSVVSYDSTAHQIGKTTYTYDPHGRQSTVTDARNGTTIYAYNNADLVTSVTTPYSDSVGGGSQTTTTSYNLLLQATNVLQPDGTSVSMSYLPTGEMQQTSGSRTYPVGYSYDYGGRMLTMTNWTNFSTGGGARVTTWGYSPTRGFLTSKTDAAGKAVSYTYTAAGRLATRTWARGTNATYGYDTGGQLASVAYSDSTPGLTNLRDRLGRVTSTVCNGTTTSFTYDLANDVLSESYSGGTLGGLKITNRFDIDLRRTNTALLNGATTLCQAIYGYDNASRLSTVSDGVNNAAYTYLANSSLVGQIVFSSNTVTRMTTTKQYDFLNRLSSIASTPSNSFAYLYNAANQRTMARLADSSYWHYNYDALGQVVQGDKYWVDQTIVAGQQFNYTFDNIGNRTQTQIGGDQNGANLRLANYTNNNLNQITSRGVPAYVDIMGDGLATNGVTVNGSNAYRKNEYFRQQLPVTNTSAVWDSITVSATNQGSITGHVYVAQNPENYTYDADGNLLSDGRWNYTWDAENRLLSMTSLSGAPSGSQLQLTFAYDYMGRRIQKQVSTNNGSYIGEYTNKYAYDGWNCVATMSPSFTLSNTFLWGNDLSGSLTGAGGVGGLLKVAYYGATTTNAFVAFDGNGNVSALINAANGATVANYEYGPFGELIRCSGPMAKLNPCRFSTKFDDDESDFLYYGYRYYNPGIGRWVNRDPSQESGGFNLYWVVKNDTVNHVDNLGLWATDVHHQIVVDWLSPGSVGSPGPGNYYSYPWSPCCTIDVIACLQEGSDEVDGVSGIVSFCEAQSSALSYQHAMSDGAIGQSVDQAQTLYLWFLSQNISTAKNLADIARQTHSCDLEIQALITLGKAYHSYSDSLSPAHSGFQPWWGLLDGPTDMGYYRYYQFFANHHARETMEIYNFQRDSVVSSVGNEFNSDLKAVLSSPTPSQ